MALTKNAVIWINDKYGVALDEYEGKYSLKGVRTYKGRDGNEVITYDWIYAEVYDPAQKKRVMAEKPRPSSVYLGGKEEAFSALTYFMGKLAEPSGNSSAKEESEVPF